jgi:hypothetical protein
MTRYSLHLGVLEFDSLPLRSSISLKLQLELQLQMRYFCAYRLLFASIRVYYAAIIAYHFCYTSINRGHTVA